MRSAAILALLLTAPPALGADAPRQLAPAPAAVPAAPTPEPGNSWELCRVRTSLLATSPGRSVRGREVERFLSLGEAMDVEDDVLVPLAKGQALVHVKARLRAAAARNPGASYFVSSEGVISSSVGFTAEGVGVSQFRSDLLDVTDGASRLYEVFADPALGLRVLLALRAQPASGAEELSGAEALLPPTGDPRQFGLEAYLKEGGALTMLDRASLAAHDGRTASYALRRFGTEGVGGRPLGLTSQPGVAYVHVQGLPTVDVERVATVDADDAFQRRIDAVQDSLHQDLTTDLGARKLPGQYQVSTPRKISKQRREKIVERQRQLEIRDWAVARSKTLPTGEDVPEGFQQEELSLELTPLRESVDALQVEIVLRGHVKLPREEETTAIDLRMIEAIEFGETLELGLAELVRGGEPEYDYIFRITCRP